MQLNEIHDNHEHASTSLKTILLVFAIVLVGTLGYLVWDFNRTADTTDYSNNSITKRESETPTTPKNTSSPYSTIKSSFNFSFEYPKEWLFSANGKFDGLPAIVYTALEQKKGEEGVYNEQLLTVRAITYPESVDTFEKYFNDQASQTRENMKDVTIGKEKLKAKKFDDGGGMFGTTISYLVSSGKSDSSDGINFVTLSVTVDNPMVLPAGFQHMLDTFKFN